MALTIDHYHFPSIDSTNLWAKSNAKHFHISHLTIVSAGTQTAGKGREDRKWVSPPHVNIYASFCLFFLKTRKDLANVPQVVAIAIADYLQRQGLEARIKWPNDILIKGKKIGGILAETTSVENHMAMIVGVGLNVNMTQNELKEITKKLRRWLLKRVTCLTWNL